MPSTSFWTMDIFTKLASLVLLTHQNGTRAAEASNFAVWPKSVKALYGTMVYFTSLKVTTWLLVIFGFNQGASGPQHQFTSTKALFASHSKEKRLEADKWASGNKTQMHRHKISWLLMPQPRNNKALQDAAQK